MDLFNILTMIGGLSLFLFGMNFMGQALERRAGGKLTQLLSTLTTGKMGGFLTGLGVTAVVQSSSATTVMVVGFVGAGIMTLSQAVNVIMGANVGTTVTGWILSLSGIDGASVWVRLLKPSSFTPILALIGIILYLFCKKEKQKSTGMIFLGFATLMFGMETMSGAVSGLGDDPAFRELFLLFQNPLMGLLAGILLTGIIQSSAAALGILQALSVTGAISYGAVVPLVMGDAIGTCVTAMLSSVGAKRDAKRTAVVHLLFNVIGAGFWMIVYLILRAILQPAILSEAATPAGIALVNTIFKLASTALLLPMSSLLEKLAIRLVPGSAADEEEQIVLDEHALAKPALALAQSREAFFKMAGTAIGAMDRALTTLSAPTDEAADAIRRGENLCDRYEDVLGTYLVKLSTCRLSEAEGEETTAILKSIGDFERISDHAVNVLAAAEELRDKNIRFSEQALREFGVLADAVSEILSLSLRAARDNDLSAAAKVEPLEQVIDCLKEELRTRHILRMQEGVCTAELGFVWADLLTDLERVGGHCSNIAGCVLDKASHHLNLHETLNRTRLEDEAYRENFQAYSKLYSVDEM